MSSSSLPQKNTAPDLIAHIGTSDNAELVLALADLRTLDIEPLWRNLLPSLPAMQQKHIQSARRWQDRYLRFTARLLAATVLQQLCKLPGKKCLELFAQNRCGKPYFTGSPWQVSLSHSWPYAVCLLGRKDLTGSVGVDIEKIRQTTTDIPGSIFTRNECNILEKSSTPGTTFTQLWTAKEAVLKVLGTGFLHNPLDIDISTRPMITTMKNMQLLSLRLEQKPAFIIATATQFPVKKIHFISPLGSQNFNLGTVDSEKRLTY